MSVLHLRRLLSLSFFLKPDSGPRRPYDVLHSISFLEMGEVIQEGGHKLYMNAILLHVRVLNCEFWNLWGILDT